ncbi:Cobalamin synthesis protein cobW [Gracilaria domingensis]|nr:Cobalamin synthesis protein cobW [Gracilaria domingensis]
MEWGCRQPQAFIPPIPSLRTFKRGFLMCQPPHRQHHTFRKTPLRSSLRALSRIGLSSVRIVAVQTSPVSGDNDGELHEEQHALQKSYSVGVTIVSGYDASLRRSVIEQIAAEYEAGRLVVVTSGGIAFTEEPDALGREATVPDQTKSGPSTADEVSNSKVMDDDRSGSTWDESESDSFPESDASELTYSTNLAAKPEGWISCSSTDEMAEVIAKLATSRECDYIVAEGSMDTNMEPQDFARLFRNRGGASLRVDTLVSVVDGSMLLKDLSGLPVSREEENLGDDNSQSKGMSHLSSTNSPEDIRDLTDTRPMTVVSLVENANVVVVKQATTSAGLVEMSRARELVYVLNGAADIISATDKQLPIDKLVNTNTYDHESFLLGATWKRVLLATRNVSNGSVRPTLPKSLKDATFVYRARRPFHPTRLYEHIKAVATFEGVIRSTGRIWLATRMLAPLEWNQAGVSATLRVGDLFWAAVAEEDWPTDDAQRERIMEDWDTQYGDRETEIVFVGKGIDKLRLQGLLDGCLLQDEEMVFNNMWENFEDPFVEWVPLIEDDEEVGADSEELMAESTLQEKESDTAGMEKQLENDDYVLQAEANSFSFDSQEGEVLDVVDVDQSSGKREEGATLDELLSGNGEPEDIVLEEPLEKFSTERGQQTSKINGFEADEKEGIVNEQKSELEERARERDTALSEEDAERELEPNFAIPESEDSSDSEKPVNDVEEGQVNESGLSEDIMDRIGALDMFEDALSGSDSNMQPLSSNSEYDEDETVIASWDGSVADGILRQVPKRGLPVTLVTGFLGSGKTTLLNYILREDHGLRIAVLVNEFGEIDIDNQLVEKGDWSSNDEMLELVNGCICCNINDSFLNAVLKILERSDDIDYLIVETTGLADPVPVINSLMVSDIAEKVRVDGILTLVDADNFDPESMKSEAALSQIMAADTILLSKTDVAPPERVQGTIEYLKTVRPAARILRSQKGRVPIRMILDVGVRVADSPAHFDPVNAKADKEEEEERGVDANDSRTLVMENGDVDETSTINDHEQGLHRGQDGHEHEHSHEHRHDHEHEHDPHCEHDCSHEHHHNNHLEVDGFVTTSFKSDKPLDPEMFMNNFLSKLPEGVFRAKGLLSFSGYAGRYVFQLSGRRYQFEEDEWPEGVEPGNQLVIIGRDLDLETLKTTLGECIV